MRGRGQGAVGYGRLPRAGRGARARERRRPRQDRGRPRNSGTHGLGPASARMSPARRRAGRSGWLGCLRCRAPPAAPRCAGGAASQAFDAQSRGFSRAGSRAAGDRARRRRGRGQVGRCSSGDRILHATRRGRGPRRSRVPDATCRARSMRKTYFAVPFCTSFLDRPIASSRLTSAGRPPAYALVPSQPTYRMKTSPELINVNRPRRTNRDHSRTVLHRVPRSRIPGRSGVDSG